MPLILATTEPGEPEIFASIQGEGASIGRPCTFVRLSRCNLACVWCDTAYTWRFAGDNRPHRDDETFDRGEEQVTLPEEETARRIAALGQHRLVITGGEPLLQAPALARMVAHLQGLVPGTHVEIETNGSVPPHPALDALVDQYNVSPKLSHSGNPADLALNPDRLAHWATEPRAWFKFVVAEPADVEEVVAIQQAHAIPGSRIFLMPEGRDSATIRQRSHWLAQTCSEHEFNLTDRLHIHLFGDTRGT
ncbi:MAG: 7-carboxy-7-deazaguanine synthase QueE [Novosphingobium sp.]|nr:MAG: 7-carboxy-7-deazaguanine synthase QueE [Novosphingobium sp.]